MESVGAEVEHLRCAETLPPEVLEKMHAPPKPEDVLEMTTGNVSDLNHYDGIMFGISARFGGIPAQMKTIMDDTGGLWQSGKLVGKTARISRHRNLAGRPGNRSDELHVFLCSPGHGFYSIGLH